MLPTRTRLLQVYAEACNYPGVLDEARVDEALARYLAALGVKRSVRRLRPDWTLEGEPSLRQSVDEVLKDFAQRSPKNIRDARDARAALDARAARAALDARDALDARAALAALDARDALAARAALDARDALAALAARAALDARDTLAALDASDARDALAALDASDARDARDTLAARDARDTLAARDALDAVRGLSAASGLRRFAAWCVQGAGYWYWRWELSWIATTYIGAVQLGLENVKVWSQPLYDAFLAGAWFLFWTPDTLYWVAKPRVHVEVIEGRRRLHNERYAAIESDVENVYFWHGVLVPAHAVVKPEWITVKEIQDETNVEVRRVLMERYGLGRYLEDSGAKKIHADELGELYRTDIEGDEPLVMVKVMNSTPEPDGSLKPYFLRVPPQMTRARDAVAWTFGYRNSAAYLKSLQQQT